MKNTKEAIGYAIETLNVTPEEFFMLIESSNGYEGEEYSRWLANEVIKIAEKDGVGFSQLLVKKFSIIQSLSENSEAVIKPKWLDKMKEMLGSDNIVSIDFDGFGDPLEGIDWYKGFDYNEVTSDFTLEVLPDEIADAIVNRKEICFVASLSKDNPDKNSDLYKACKSANIVCKNEGSLLLYRMINMIEAFNSGKEFKFAFLTDVDFLTSVDNALIFAHLLKYFNCSGFTLKATDLYDGVFVNGDYAYVVCSPRGLEDALQDCISLTKYAYSSDSKVKKVLRRYTHSGKKMLQYLIESAPECVDDVPSEESGSLSDVLVKGNKKALGYLNLNEFDCAWVSTLPDLSAKVYIPITNVNLSEVITYVGVTESLKHFGMPYEIPLVVNGALDYPNLAYNCLPIFLYGVTSKFRGHDGVVGVLSPQGSVTSRLLEKGEVYFSFEAKQLLDTCKGFINRLAKQGILYSEYSFNDIRKKVNSNDLDLNGSYLESLNNCMEYVKSLYRKM